MGFKYLPSFNDTHCTTNKHAVRVSIYISNNGQKATKN